MKKIFMIILMIPCMALGQMFSSSSAIAGSATCNSIMDNGGDNTGSSDNSTAFLTTAALGPSGKGCVYFPPGSYRFAGQVTYTLPSNSASLAIKGDGQDVSVLNWPSGGGLSINYPAYTNSVTVSGLTFATGANGSATGLALNQSGTAYFGTVPAASLISNVVFRGMDGYQATNYWGTALWVSGVSSVNVLASGFWGASAISGTGIHYVGSGGIYAVQENVTDSIFSGLALGVIYDANTQGVSVISSNFTNVGVGIDVPSGIAGTSQLTVMGSQFNCTISCINMWTGVDSTIVQGNLFFLGQAVNGLYLNPSSSSLISGNAFVPAKGGETANSAITFNGYKAFSSIVTGNQCSGLVTCVQLTSNAKYVNVQSNSYSGNSNNVINNCATGCTVGGGSP